MHIDEITPDKGQRTLIIGASRSGKSVLADHIEDNVKKIRPDVEELVVDTKPRFRAEIERFGPGMRAIRDADHHYRDWEKGPTIPGSYRHDLTSNDLSQYWKPKDRCRTVIIQTDKEDQRPRLLELSNMWFEVRKKHADRLYRVNELLDLYYQNGVCISSRYNVPLKVNRAGGERGFSGLYEAQRPRGIPNQMVEEMTDLFLFHLRFDDDMKHLWANGVPRDVFPPKCSHSRYEECNYQEGCEKHCFRWVRIYPGGHARDNGLHRLTPKPEYLAQLSDT